MRIRFRPIIAIAVPLVLIAGTGGSCWAAASTCVDIFKPSRLSAGVVRVKQSTDYTCGPASLKSVLETLGLKSPSELRLAQQMSTSRNYGTLPDQLVRGAIASGADARFRQLLNVDDIRSSLQKKRLLIVLVRLEGESHWEVVDGLSDRTIRIMDPYPGKFVPMPIREFVGKWWGEVNGTVWSHSAVEVWRSPSRSNGI